MTALDLWLVLCVLFVASAMFEYAVMLGVGFERQLQRKIDRCALAIFLVAYVMAVSIYCLRIIMS